MVLDEPKLGIGNKTKRNLKTTTEEEKSSIFGKPEQTCQNGRGQIVAKWLGRPP